MYAFHIEGKKYMKKAKDIKSNIHNVWGLHAVFEWHNRNDAQTVVYKIEIARDVHEIRKENRSKNYYS